MKFENDPLVSVVVITYNHFPFIENCLNSILSQKTTFPYEIILGEDDSNDGTREFCVSLAKVNPQIKLRLQKRENVIYINNTSTGRYNFLDCVSCAKGKYVAFCEGDDFWDSPDKLQVQYDLLEQNTEYTGSFHDSFVIDSSNIRLGLFRKPLSKVMHLEDLIRTTAPFHTSSFFVRKQLLIGLPNFMKEIMSFDMALFLIVGNNGPFIKAENIFSSYRKHENGITNKPGIKNNYHQIRIEMLSKVSNYLGEAGRSEFERVIEWHQNAMERESFVLQPPLLKKIQIFVRGIFK